MFESVVELELEVEVEVEVVVSTLESPPEELLEESEDFLVEDTVFFSSSSLVSSSSVSSFERGRPSPGAERLVATRAADLPNHGKMGHIDIDKSSTRQRYR